MTARPPLSVRSAARLARRPAVLLWLVAALAGHGTHAGAAGRPADVALAEALFQEGQRLMQQGRFAEACPKLEESHRVEPALGTMLYLAECYERNGQTASAWATFRAAAHLARRSEQPRREQLAAERATKLEGRLSRLVVRIAPNADSARLSVTRDGVPLERPAWGVAVPVDPGPHELRAQAPGAKPWSQSIDVSAAASVVEVTIPALEPESVVVAPPRASASPPVPPVAPGPRHPGAGRRSPGLSAQEAAGLVVAGVGAASLGIGTFFALRARSRDDESYQHCSPSDPSRCSPRGVELVDEARHAATIANVGFAIGGAAVVGGLVLFATAPSRSQAATRAGADVSPLLGPQTAGLSIRSVW
jgi:hypothetical protein